MKTIFLPVFFVLVMSSCTNSNKHETKVSEEILLQETVPQTAMLKTGCYAYQDNTDTVRFEITDIENGIKGKLSYALREKDKNTGTFSGAIDENHLFGVYTFMSEGVESKREVAFMIKDDQLIEGYGDLNSEGNGFKDKNKIHYTSTMPLSKIDCSASKGM